MSRFFKLIRPNRTHYGLVYKEGLNTLPPDEAFKPSSCASGGLYYADEQSIWRWLHIYEFNPNLLIAEVTLCPAAK